MSKTPDRNSHPLQLTGQNTPFWPNIEIKGRIRQANSLRLVASVPASFTVDEDETIMFMSKTLAGIGSTIVTRRTLKDTNTKPGKWVVDDEVNEIGLNTGGDEKYTPVGRHKLFDDISVTTDQAVGVANTLKRDDADKEIPRTIMDIIEPEPSDELRGEAGTVRASGTYRPALSDDATSGGLSDDETPDDMYTPGAREPNFDDEGIEERAMMAIPGASDFTVARTDNGVVQLEAEAYIHPETANPDGQDGQDEPWIHLGRLMIGSIVVMRLARVPIEVALHDVEYDATIQLSADAAADYFERNNVDLSTPPSDGIEQLIKSVPLDVPVQGDIEYSGDDVQHMIEALFDNSGNEVSAEVTTVDTETVLTFKTILTTNVMTDKEDIGEIFIDTGLIEALKYVGGLVNATDESFRPLDRIQINGESVRGDTLIELNFDAETISEYRTEVDDSDSLYRFVIRQVNASEPTIESEQEAARVLESVIERDFQDTDLTLEDIQFAPLDQSEHSDVEGELPDAHLAVATDKMRVVSEDDDILLEDGKDTIATIYNAYTSLSEMFDTFDIETIGVNTAVDQDTISDDRTVHFNLKTTSDDLEGLKNDELEFGDVFMRAAERVGDDE